MFVLFFLPGETQLNCKYKSLKTKSSKAKTIELTKKNKQICLKIMSDLGDLHQSGLSCSKQLTLIPKSRKQGRATSDDAYDFLNFLASSQYDPDLFRRRRAAVKYTSSSLTVLPILHNHKKHESSQDSQETF